MTLNLLRQGNSHPVLSIHIYIIKFHMGQSKTGLFKKSFPIKSMYLNVFMSVNASMGREYMKGHAPLLASLLMMPFHTDSVQTP